MQKTVLVIEDDPQLRKAYEVKFAREKFKMLGDASGQNGVETAKRERPDIILLDMLLGGGMNGLEVLRLLKEDAVTKAIPVMVLTNSSTPATAGQVLQLGAASYHVKAHVSMDDIVAEIRTRTAG